MPSPFLHLWRNRSSRHLAATILLLGLTAQAKSQNWLESARREMPAEWSALQSGIEDEQAIIAQCRGDPVICQSSVVRAFFAIVREGARYEGRARVAHINRAANLAIRSTKSYEKWIAPLAALAKGFGNCKQYAVLKYAALSEAGYGEGHLRIVIVEDKRADRLHAVVAVQSGKEWIVLNNQSSVLVESDEFFERYPPVSVLPQPLYRAKRKPNIGDEKMDASNLMNATISAYGP